MIQKQSKIKLIVLAILSIITSSSIANPTNITAICAPSHLGKIALFHDENGFHVSQNGIHHDVQKVWMDPILRNIAPSQLEKFLSNGYIQVSQMSDNEFALKAKIRLKGGGPILASIVYGSTKAICYGTAAAAIGGAVVVTGGAAGAAIGGAAAAAAGGIAATTGAAVAAGAIAGAGATATAVTATTATVAAAGGVVGAIAFIESVSLFFSAAALALPTP